MSNLLLHFSASFAARVTNSGQGDTRKLPGTSRVAFASTRVDAGSSLSPFCFGNHRFVFYVWESTSVKKFIFIIFLYSTYKWYQMIGLSLTSLGMVISTSVLVGADGIVHPFYGWVIFPCTPMPHTFFIHSSVDKHLGYFRMLAIVNSAAINIGCMCLFKTSLHLFWIYVQEQDCRIIWWLCF